MVCRDSARYYQILFFAPTSLNQIGRGLFWSWIFVDGCESTSSFFLIKCEGSTVVEDGEMPVQGAWRFCDSRICRYLCLGGFVKWLNQPLSSHRIRALPAEPQGESPSRKHTWVWPCLICTVRRADVCCAAPRAAVAPCVSYGYSKRVPEMRSMPEKRRLCGRQRLKL